MTKMAVEYIDHMGNDLSVINAARVSMDKDASSFTEAQNNSLINYLANGVSQKEMNERLTSISEGTPDAEALYHSIRNTATHWTPFAHTAISLRVKAPIPIRTQCFKHKSGLVENEESRRYITCTPEIYIPDVFRSKAANVKQGSAGEHPHSAAWIQQYQNQCNEAVALYTSMIDNDVCPEQARLVLPQGAMVNWIWTGNLFSFANFFNKRTDPHAQAEIAELANQIGDIIAPLFPVSWEALTK